MRERRPERAPRDARERRPRPDGKPERPVVLRDPEVILARQDWAGVRALLPDADEAVFENLRAYARLLLGWSQGVSNLISRHDEPRFVERHLLESLAPARFLRDSGAKRFLDFGSGGGLPAIPLCLLGIGESWTLVESRRNKTLFLRKVQQELGLSHLDVITDRLEDVIGTQAVEGGFDGFTSRATATLGPTLELAAKVMRPGGHAFLWKGSGHVEELAACRSQIDGVWRHETTHPIGNGMNVVCVFQYI